MFKKTLLIGGIAIAIGVVASLASIGFVYLIKIASQLLMVSSESRSGMSGSMGSNLLLILTTTLGGLVVGLLCYGIQGKRPLTLVDTIRSAQGMQFDTPVKFGFLSALSSIVAIGSGASVGKYGPLAHLGSTLGLIIRGWTGSVVFSSSMALGCGVAAAISTAFNAPIAGLIFAHEVILRHYSLRAFAPITVSAVVGYIFANYVFDRPPIFHVASLARVNSVEFLVFIAIGLFGAFVAAGMVRTTLYAGFLADKITVSPVFKPAIAGAAVGLMAIWVPEVLGIGESVMRDVLIGDGFPTMQMLLILGVKVIATGICLGFGMAGGIFSPALFVGILFGAVVANMAEIGLGSSFSSATPYIVCGMAAVTSPIIGAPLTLILIVIELSRNYDLAVVAMVSVVFANLVGYQLMGRSIFDIQLKSDGFDLGMGREKAIMDSRDISDYVSDDFVSVLGGNTLSELKDTLVQQEKGDGFIVSDAGELLGSISLSKLLILAKTGVSLDQQCCEHLSVDETVLNASTTIWSAMEILQEFVGESIAVISDDEHRILIGIVYESSVMKGYMDTIKSVRAEEHGLG